MRFKIFFLIICLFKLITVFGISDEFVPFSKENNKLTNNIVEAVVRDNYGYVWVGTNNGLNRLDGYSTKNFMYDPLDSTTISSNNIKSLLVDADGDLWIGTIDGGLNLYDRENSSFIHFTNQDKSKNNFSGKNISSIIQDKNGLIWIGTIGDGIYSYHKKTKEFTHYQLNPNDLYNTNIRTLLCDSKNNIWIGFDYDSNGIYRIDGLTNDISFYSPQKQQGKVTGLGPVRGIIELNDGRIIASTWTGRFYEAASDGSFSLNLFKDESFLNNASISHMINDRDGNIFVGCWEQGLYQLSDEFNIINHYEKDVVYKSSIQSNAITSLYIDSQNNLWVAHRNNGVSMLNMNKQMFKKLNIELNGKKISDNIDVQAFAKDKYNNLWFATRGSGLWKYNLTSNTFKQFSTKNGNGLKTDFLLTLHIDDEGFIWVGTDGKFIARFDPVTEKFKHIDFNWSDWSAVFAIAETDKFLWCGTWGSGVKILDKKSFNVTTIDFDLSDQYRNSVFDVKVSDSLLWIANIGIGLYCYNLNNNQLELKFSSETKKADFPNFRINDLYIENPNTLWISTSGGGSVRYNIKNNQIQIVDQNNGLSSAIVQTVLTDSNKKYWFLTQNGITVTNSEFSQPVNFYTHNGLLSNTINKSSAFYDSTENRVYVGTQLGINYFDTQKIIIDSTVNSVIFTGLSVLGEEIPPSKHSFFNTNIEVASTITLQPKQNLFTIYFSSMDFNPSFLNCYYYQLEGFDKNWIYTPFTKNFAQYTNLDPGTYTLKVKTLNRDGIESSKYSSIKIIVKPTFYQTLFFKIASLLLLIITIAFVYRIRYRSLHKAKLLLEKNVKERTAEIERQKQFIEKQNMMLEESNASKDRFFSIIGHDLNNPMSSIDQLLEYLASDYKNMSPEMLEKVIRQLKKSSAHTIELLKNLMTWARTQTQRIEINSTSHPIFELFAEVQKTCEILALKKNQQLEFHTHPDLYGYFDFNTISAVLRNLITNAIKFSHPNQTITITTQTIDNEIIVSVSDQGTGIRKENLINLFKIENIKTKNGTNGETGTGFGLILCHEFVLLNKGKIWAESTYGKGSTFFFSIEKHDV